MNKNTKLKSTKDRRKELMSEPDLEFKMKARAVLFTTHYIVVSTDDEEYTLRRYYIYDLAQKTLILKTDNFIYRSLDESHENIFYIDQKSRFSFIEKKTFEKYSHESKSVSDSIESIVDLVQLDRAFKYMFAVTTSNSTKKVIYSMNLKTENVQTYKIKGNQVLDATSDYNGDFFYIGVEYTKLYEIPAIHVFKLGDVLIERTLILEIPDFGFISAIHAYYNLLLVFVSERVLVMRRDDPRRFVLESTHGLPFSKDSEGKMGSKRVDQVGVFGRYHVGVIRFGYGFVLKKVTDYISKEEGGRGRHILDRSESFEQGVGGGSFDMMSGVGGD